MTRRVAAGRASAVWVAGLVLALTAGCGSGDEASLQLVPVSGKVTLDGKPLADANLEFIPLGETLGRGGVAKTDADGGYKAATVTRDPGLPVGTYAVAVSKRVFGNGAPPPDAGSPAARDSFKETVPLAYSDRRLTPLKTTVAAGGASSNNLDLKSNLRK
jgi:hypothetical protein